MKSWAWAAVGLLVGAGMVGGAACGSGNGTGGGGTGGGTGGSASTVNPQTSTSTTGGQGGMAADCGSFVPAGIMPAACGSCIAGACCDEAKKCDPAGATPCGMLLGCLLQATDASGIIACEMQNAAGAADLLALENCAGASKCVGGTSPACPAPEALCLTNTIGYNNTQMNPIVDQCNQCLGSLCCDEFSKLTVDVTNDPACATPTPPCTEFADLQACSEDPTGCSGGADAKAAAQCQDMKCGATCGVPICDSGIQNTGTSAFTCSTCLDTSCCAEFEAGGCMGGETPACDMFLMDLGTCANDPTCGGDMVAQAAFDCQNTNCMSDCM